MDKCRVASNISIWVLLLLWISSFSCGYHVLLIGDSVDRYIVVDWCYIDRPKPASKLVCPDCIYWFEETGSKWDSSICIKGNDSIANVHHFGSRDQGPYFSKPVVGERDLSPNIIRNSIYRYFDRIGAPDLILYQAVLWDVAYIKALYESEPQNKTLLDDLSIENTATWNESISTYTTNMRHRIHDVKEAIKENLARLNLPTSVNFGLHTTVYNKHIGNLANGFNNAIRALTHEYNLTLFDFDNEAWSTYNWNRDKEAFVMRDIVHPLPYFTGLAALKLLGHRYSSNLIFRGPINTHTSHPKICLTAHKNHRYHCPLTFMKSEPTTEVKLIASFPSAKNSHNHRRKLRSRRNLLRQDGSYHKQFPNPGESRALLFSEIAREEAANLSTPIYYLHHDPTSLIPERVGPINDHLRVILRLSQGEILYMPPEDVEALPMSHLRFPPIGADDSRNSVINTTSGLLYIYFPDREVFRLYSSTIQGLSLFGFTTLPPTNTTVAKDATIQSNAPQSNEWTCPNITQNISDLWLNELFAIGPPLPNIYYHGSLIRLASQREVYVVLQGVKHMIPNVSVFMQYGSDWSQVQVIADIDDFNRIPTGSSL